MSREISTASIGGRASTGCGDRLARGGWLHSEPATDGRSVVLISEDRDFDAHGPYEHTTALELARSWRAELDSYDLPEVEVSVARLFADGAGGVPPLAECASGYDLDSRIRVELSKPPADTAGPTDDLTELRRVAGRQRHALRAVLAECGALETDPNTAQLAEDLRMVITEALRLGST